MCDLHVLYWEQVREKTVHEMRAERDAEDLHGLILHLRTQVTCFMCPDSPGRRMLFASIATVHYAASPAHTACASLGTTNI